MIINKPLKTTGESIDYLNKAVFGEDPDYTVLSRVYESSIPIQDRVNDLETNRVNEATVEALQAKVDSLEALTTMFANLAYPVPNLVSNGDFSGGLTGYTPISGTRDSLSINNNKLRVTALRNDFTLGFNVSTNNLLANNIYYLAITDFYTNSLNSNMRLLKFNPVNSNPIFTSTDNSLIFQLIYNAGSTSLFYFQHSSGDWLTNEYFEMSSFNIYNVSQMKLKGVKDDNGTPFTLLTNTQIKTQLDLWITTQFPLEVLLQMNS